MLATGIPFIRRNILILPPVFPLQVGRKVLFVDVGRAFFSQILCTFAQSCRNKYLSEAST